MVASIFPHRAFCIDTKSLLAQLKVAVPGLDVALLERSLAEGSTRTPKSGYEYVLWDVAKVGALGQLDENSLVAGAIALACSSPAGLSLIKIDVVKILQQDAYGKPRWDTAQRLGHVEVPTDRCDKVVGVPEPLTVEAMKAIPSQMKVHL